MLHVPQYYMNTHMCFLNRFLAYASPNGMVANITIGCFLLIFGTLSGWQLMVNAIPNWWIW